LSKISYFYDFEESGALGDPNRILRDTGTEAFNRDCTEKAWTHVIPKFLGKNY